MMKISPSVILVPATLLSVLAYAQTNTPAVNVAISPMENTELIITFITPIIVHVVNKITPEIPSNLRFLLPLSTPFIGIALASIINYLSGQNLTWWDGAKAGAIAVAVREVWNQTITKQMLAAKENQQATPNPPPTPPSAPDQNQSTT